MNFRHKWLDKQISLSGNWAILGFHTGCFAALKKARVQFAEGQAGKKMSDEIRAKVVADLDRAIADLEKPAD